MDWGRKDYPGTKSRKTSCVKRQQRKTEQLEKEREEEREKTESCSGTKDLGKEKQGKSRI